MRKDYLARGSGIVALEIFCPIFRATGSVLGPAALRAWHAFTDVRGGGEALFSQMDCR